MNASRKSLHLSLTVPAELPQLRFLTGMIERFLSDGAGLGPERREHQQLQLAIREASSNVIRHAYEGGGSHPLRLQLRIVPGGIHVRVEDRGRPIPAAILRESESGSRTGSAAAGRSG